MTAQEYVLWLKGVIAGSPRYQPNPEQWAAIRNQIEKVGDVTETVKPATNPLDNRILLTDNGPHPKDWVSNNTGL